jgi:hypothetical protein
LNQPTTREPKRTNSERGKDYMRNNKLGMLAGVGTAIMLLAATGCETTNTKDERSEGRVIDDQHITENVQKSLESEPTYKFTDVKVNTFAGIVQLSGFVNTQDQKNRAQQIAQDTDGVKDVHNGLALKPLMPTSRKNAGEQIYSEPQNPSQSPKESSESK